MNRTLVDRRRRVAARVTNKRPNASLMIATLGGAGYTPFAPGTIGSLVSIPFAALAAWRWEFGLALCALLLLVGVPTATRAARYVGTKDPGIVVIDEAIGMTVAGMGVSLGVVPLALAFLLFRFFDIIKFPPCRRLEKIPGGWGIILDDVAAGIYAAVVAHYCLKWFL